MQANEYQQRTSSIAVYKGVGTDHQEELKVKKLLRDGKIDKSAIVEEIGDVCWNMARLASALGVTLEDVLQMNYEKLQSRKERDTLQGNGDNR